MKMGFHVTVRNLQVLCGQCDMFAGVVDIDECAEGAEGAVSCNHTCVNTNGSYFCGCDDGYVLQDNFNCRGKFRIRNEHIHVVHVMFQHVSLVRFVW